MKTKIDYGLQFLLGLAFLVFGLNKFIGFMAPPDLPPAAGAFMGALAETGYMLPFIGLTEAVTGALLLARFRSSLALVLLAPVVLNIVLFHLFLAPAGGVPAYLLAAILVYLLFQYLPQYRQLLKGR